MLGREEATAVGNPGINALVQQVRLVGWGEVAAMWDGRCVPLLLRPIRLPGAEARVHQVYCVGALAAARQHAHTDTTDHAKGHTSLIHHNITP